MKLLKRITSISLAIIMLFSITSSTYAVTTSFPIDRNNPNSTYVTATLNLRRTSANATTEMPYGFCTLYVRVTAYYFLDDSIGSTPANWGSSSVFDGPHEGYSVSATAYSPNGLYVVGAASVYGASSPDTSMNNDDSLVTGTTP